MTVVGVCKGSSEEVCIFTGSEVVVTTGTEGVAGATVGNAGVAAGNTADVMNADAGRVACNEGCWTVEATTLVGSGSGGGAVVATLVGRGSGCAIVETHG